MAKPKQKIQARAPRRKRFNAGRTILRIDPSAQPDHATEKVIVDTEEVLPTVGLALDRSRYMLKMEPPSFYRTLPLVDDDSDTLEILGRGYRGPTPPRLATRVALSDHTSVDATINGTEAKVIQSFKLGGQTAYIVVAPDAETELDQALGEIAQHRREELLSGKAVAYPAEIDDNIVEGTHPIRAIRAWRGLSQAELAAIAETSGEFVGQIERGARNLTAAMADKLADALDVPAEDLYPKAWLEDED